MRLHIAMLLGVASFMFYGSQEAQSQSSDIQTRMMFDQMAEGSMKPLSDENVVGEYVKIINTMSKPRLDAFVDIVSTCGSSVDCKPLLASYRLKYFERSEEDILGALQVCNNVLQPGSERRSNTASPLFTFNRLIRDAVRARYAALGG